MRICTLLFFTLAVFMAKAQPAADIIEYINKYKVLAMEEMKRTGIPAAIKLAQGVHETSAGKSVLVLKSNNHFGIKCKSYWTGKSVSHDDDAKGECFRSYDTAMDSYRDHSDFLRNSTRYASLFQLDPADYKGWATGLRKAGYATNPKYAPILIRIIEQYNLQQYSLIAMGRMLPSEEVVARLPAPEIPVPVIELPAEPLPEEIPPAPAEVPDVSSVKYPLGEFTINNTRVIFAKQGTSLLSIAQEYDISFSRLLEFNDMEGEEVLLKDQLLYLQRKRKTGNNEYHIVAEGESLHDICQVEAIRLQSLMEYNHFRSDTRPVVGQKLYLHAQSPTRQKL